MSRVSAAIMCRVPNTIGKSGLWRGILCSEHGEPYSVGAMLLQFYPALEWAWKLMDCGDLRYLGPTLELYPWPHGTKMKMRDEGLCALAHSATDPESDVEVLCWDKIGGEMQYLHNGHQWMFRKDRAAGWEPLTRKECGLR
jgi:hypothetical protein